MSNKRQLEILQNIRSAFIFRKCGSKQRCDLRILELFVCSLLLTSSILCVASAKLEAKNENNLKLNANADAENKEIQIKLHSKSADVINHSTVDENEQHGNRLEYDHSYRSELHRLPYETINRILRDEKEPIFRREDIDLRYYHTRSLQPTHEVVRRSTEEITSQTNHNLNLRAQNLSEFIIADNSTQYLDAILAIDLSENRLETIELSQFKNLLSANLSHNLLTELPIKTNSSLELLNLNSNRIQKRQMAQNSNLRVLFLSGNSIENITELNLMVFSALETLDLSCNQIKNPETTLFPCLMHNLKYLNLADNRLGSISRETFYNLLSLNTLLLAHNNITFIDYETFLSLPNLQYLDLSHNHLKGESIRALQGIPDLVGLSIAYNPEMGESLQEFVASWSLKEVDASGTGLCQIPAALAQAVRTLKLADNWFKIINCGDLDSYPLLQHLDLSYSHIEDIEDDAMGRLEFLELLFLDHNQLRKVPVSLPTSLEHLFLQHNEIMDLQIPAFQGLKNLKTLDLSHNKLLYLPALPLPKLLTLNLQASGLQGLNPAIVHSLPHLRDLLLEENPIKCSDLLGIAEWASPCRIAERGNMKATDGEQIGNLDVGQQTVAKIDLKQKFVQTHNFYEKFDTSCRGPLTVDRQILPTMTPPNCAVELDDNTEEVEKPTVLAVTETDAVKVDVDADDIVEQPKFLPLVQYEPASKQINVHSNEGRKVYEHNSEATVVSKKSAVSRIESSNLMDALKHEPPTTTIIMPMATEPTILINANQTATLNAQMATKNFQTKNVVITTTVTTTAKSTKTTNVVTDMPETKFSTINSKRNFEPTTAVLLPTTLIAPTSASALNNKTESTKITTPTTMSTFVGNSLPQTMPTKIPATMTTTVNNYAVPHSSTRGSLLERQRRVEVEQTTMTTTETPAIDITLPTATMSQAPDKDLTQNIANANSNNEDDNIDDKRKSSKNSKKLENSKPQNNDAFGVNKTASTMATITTIPTQHKHVTLQLHVKDRHLIGTPLLTHHGQNLLVAAEELQNNGNHIATTQSTYATSTTSTTSTTPIIPIQKNLAKTQTKHSADQLKFVVNKDEFTGNDDVELKATEKYSIGKHTATSTLTTTRIPPKVVQKQRNEQMKKKPSLIMKKMTITTKHASTTNAPITLKDQEKQTTHQQQLHHHYTLNTPRENEVTLMAKLPTETFLNANHPMNLETSMKHQIHHGNIKHSTVNTPIINGHEHELQTFHEHNELEEAAAAAAHASTSAIVGKITKSSSTTTSTSAKWFDLRKTTAKATHPGIVILLSFGLFVVLLIGLLHVYRCDIPWPLRRQRHQQRPYRMHQQQQQQQQQQQTHFNDDDVHSFLSYQSSSSNQFNQRKWRLETTQKQKPTMLQHHQQQEQKQLQSPFHNLQVRELQPTSAVEAGPKYAKQTYKISSALGERSNSQTSSSCSPHSSGVFDDETFYIEMTTDMGQTINSDATTLAHSDLLPMELLNVSKGNIGKSDELEASSQALNSGAFQTSSFDEDTTIQSSTKLTPTTRKLGIW